MDKLEKTLNTLPRKKIPMMADLRLRWRIYKMTRPESIPLLKPVFVAAFCVVLVFSSVSSYAYASENVTEGNPLYPIKRGLEKVELSLSTPKAKEEKLIKFTKRRLNEMKRLTAVTNEVDMPKKAEVVKTLESMRKDIESAKKINAASLDSKEAKEQLDELSGLADKIPTDEKNFIVIENLARTINTFEKKEKVNLQKENSSSDSEQQQKKELLDEIKNMRKRVKEIEKASSSEEKSFVETLNKKMEQAENSANRNELKQSKEILENTSAVTDNINIFLKRRARIKDGGRSSSTTAVKAIKIKRKTEEKRSR